MSLYVPCVKVGRRWRRCCACSLPKRQAAKWLLPKYPGATLKTVRGEDGVWSPRVSYT